MLRSQPRLYPVVSEGGVGSVGERLHALGREQLHFGDGQLSGAPLAETLQARQVLAADAWLASLDELDAQENRHGL